MTGFFFALALASAAPAPSAWDPAPWLADLAVARQAVDDKYANRDWLTQERGVDLDALFARTAERLKSARSDAEARRVLERLFERFRDGHVAVRWPAPAAGPGPATAAPLCRRLGYDSGKAGGPGTAAALPGWQALGGDNVFPAGLTNVGGRRIGTLRLGVFMPQGYPGTCEDAARALALAPDAPCDEGCAQTLETAAYRRLGADFAGRLEALAAAGAEALIVDLTLNGGGSEWAGVAARMVTPTRLGAGARGYVRGAHWAKIWRGLEADFRSGAAREKGALKAQLLGWAQEARAAAAEAERACPGDTGCPRIAKAGYSTGVLGWAAPGSFAGKPWATAAWQLARYDYREGVWTRPVLVLVDQETWSAAEEFAALLQDHGAAVIIGQRTGGAGCGHVDGGTPTVLPHSKGVLELPDCVRYRADGSNEVNGIVPDVVVGFRHDDPAPFKAKLLADRLPEALARAGLPPRP